MYTQQDIFLANNPWTESLWFQLASKIIRISLYRANIVNDKYPSGVHPSQDSVDV